MTRSMRAAVAGVSLVWLAGCGQANAEKAAQMAADSAKAEGASPAEVTRRADRARQAATALESRRTAKHESRTLESGTALTLATVTDISSSKNNPGDPFIARVTSAALDSHGDTIIPAGAELLGHVATIKSAPHRGAPGTLTLEFSKLRFDSQEYPVAVRTTSMATHIVSRGLTVDDAAKVGVGAAAGAIAGKLIGHSTGATAAGAVVGGAGGAVYANQTRDYDIALSPGASVTVELTGPFTREVAVH